MSRFIQLTVPDTVSDLDIEYVMEMLRIMGQYVTKGVPQAGNLPRVVVTQGTTHTSL